MDFACRLGRRQKLNCISVDSLFPIYIERERLSKIKREREANSI
jgi:hypothetical protein